MVVVTAWPNGRGERQVPPLSLQKSQGDSKGYIVNDAHCCSGAEETRVSEPVMPA